MLNDIDNQQQVADNRVRTVASRGNKDTDITGNSVGKFPLTIDDIENVERAQLGQEVRVKVGFGLQKINIDSLDVWVNRKPFNFVIGEKINLKVVSVPIEKPGEVIIEAMALGTDGNGNDIISEKKSKSVYIPDTTAPALGIITPQQNQECNGPDNGFPIDLWVTATDFFGISRVEYILDINVAHALYKNEGEGRWEAKVFLAAVPALGQHTIKVQAFDIMNNKAESTVTFIIRDITPPVISVDFPKLNQRIVADNFPFTLKDAVLIKGTTSDKQSGMAGGQAKVEWSLDGVGYKPAKSTSNNDNWSGWYVDDCEVNRFGDFTLYIRASDRDGQVNISQGNFEIISEYKIENTSDVFSLHAYLKDLLDFAKAKIANKGAAVTDNNFEEIFFQSFVRLSQPLYDQVGKVSANELRICIEVLRKYLSTASDYKKFKPIAYWPFDEGNGQTSVDTSGNNNTASLVNATWDTGKRGKCVKLISTAGIEINNSASLDSIGKDNADFTVAFWMYLTGDKNGRWRAIMHKGNSDQERTFDLILEENSNHIYYRISTNDNWDIGGSSKKEILVNSWTHVAYVKKGKELQLFLNGILDSSVRFEGNVLPNKGTLYIGKDPWYTGMEGNIDDVCIFSFPLSEKQLSIIINNKVSPIAPDYLLVAYEQLLINAGTSYEELRLLRGTSELEKKEVADRIGIALTDSAELDQLMIEPAKISEQKLQEFFGWLNTSNDAVTTSTPDTPKLLLWQKQYLYQQWCLQDFPVESGMAILNPIIDPDLLTEVDFINPVPGNRAYDIWKARQQTVKEYYDSFQKKQDGTPIPKDRNGLAEIITEALNKTPEELLQIADKRKNGMDVTSDLNALNLMPSMLQYLVRIINLANADKGIILDSEWENVSAIFTQVKKKQQFAGWREEEKNKSITLSPGETDDLFALYTEAVVLSAWRATAADRDNRQRILSSRIDQRIALINNFYAALNGAEESAMPLLRDSLLVGINPLLTNEIAEYLTDRLQIDVKSSGNQYTTRIEQAIETVQTIIFAIRTGQLDDGHPAKGWNIAGEIEDFDKQWQWMGSYETWRAAQYVYLYPENLLLPSLKPLIKKGDEENPFTKFLGELREKHRLTPSVAEQLYNDYITKDDKNNNYLDQEDERIFYAPFQIALQLQRSGEYEAALDWYKKYIYDYNTKEKKQAPLTGETIAPPSLQKPTDYSWLGDAGNDLNVYDIITKTKRPNPYTRAVIQQIIKCLLEYGDAEFTRDTGSSLAQARELYIMALNLLDVPDMRIFTLSSDNPPIPFPANPVIEAFRTKAEVQLGKIRLGRNIAGLQRQVSTIIPTTDNVAFTSLSQVYQARRSAQPVLKPTPYRYSVLIERSKQLITIAQQVEAAYLSALEKFDEKNYRRFEANQHIEIADMSVKLQDLRVTEAQRGITITQEQKERVQAQIDGLGDLIDAGLNQFENALLDNYKDVEAISNKIADIDTALSIANISVQAASGATGSGGATLVLALSSLLAASEKDSATTKLNNAQYNIQVNSLEASQERRKQEWKFQRTLANKDLTVALEQINAAQDRKAIVDQEKAIAQRQLEQDKAAVEFLDKQFTNVELYEWMSGVLGQVYSYFLQQATAIALLAQNQLTFERHDVPPAFIQNDYWQLPSTNDSGSETSKDRRGLTGSARLLQDIYQLDQFAFETDKRKLQLTQAFSLARLAPFEFQQFRETGVLKFSTPMELFDRAFPGHYLRLIKRVKTSIIALVPPVQGIRASLTASGISRVMVGQDTFQETIIRRDPEMVALTSPYNATGLFEMDIQADMLLPFEGMGVDTNWELQLPKAANPFDFRTIADVLITIEYTALNSYDYKRQVIQKLGNSISSDRTISIRQQFPDVWYNLHNADQLSQEQQMVLDFKTTRDDFPVYLENLNIQQLTLLILQAGGKAATVDVNELSFTPVSSTEFGMVKSGKETSTMEGIISTRRGAWKEIINTPALPVTGDWKITLPNTQEMKDRFDKEEIEDIALIVTYTGKLPAWV
jgi:hypothetical protein